jgi:hypothetical protein
MVMLADLPGPQVRGPTFTCTAVAPGAVPTSTVSESPTVMRPDDIPHPTRTPEAARSAANLFMESSSSPANKATAEFIP